MLARSFDNSPRCWLQVNTVQNDPQISQCAGGELHFKPTLEVGPDHGAPRALLRREVAASR